MLLKFSTIQKHTVAATDGTIGTVSDVLFDDSSWTIRWLVVDTGNWLSGRKVLLPPTVLGHAAHSDKSFPVLLTRAEIEASPALEEHLPVSRQFETSTYTYYGWSPYWGSGNYLGGYGFAGMAPMMENDPEVQRRIEDMDRRRNTRGEPCLRSADRVTGYHIHATDGQIGHLTDIVLEDEDWSIRYLVIDTSNWWGGQEVLISPRSVNSIRWTERLIYLDVDQQRIKDSPPWDAGKPLDREHESRLASHYGEAKTAPVQDQLVAPLDPPLQK
jgi:sporulation protein YlmC with PRC-barrel domain